VQTSSLSVLLRADYPWGWYDHESNQCVCQVVVNNNNNNNNNNGK
jgi:hypothetical protein